MADPFSTKIGRNMGTIYERTHTQYERIWCHGCGVLPTHVFEISSNIHMEKKQLSNQAL